MTSFMRTGILFSCIHFCIPSAWNTVNDRIDSQKYLLNEWLSGREKHTTYSHYSFFFFLKLPSSFYTTILPWNIVLGWPGQKRKSMKFWLVSVQLLSHVWLFATPWTAAYQASLSITNSQSLLKLMSVESVMLSNHLILCCPLLLLPSIFPSIRVFSNESVLRIRWSKYWNYSFSISPSNIIQDWSPLQWTSWISLQSKGLLRVFSTPQFKSISSSALSFLCGPTLTSVYDYWKSHTFD